MNIMNFVLKIDDTILNALMKIEDNKKGFLIILNDDSTVAGTLTDGDIRRAFIKGYNVDDIILDICKDDFNYVNESDDFSKIVEIFKSEKIEFLPIVNEKKYLINIITKKNMHVLLMEAIKFDLKYDFLSLDDTKLEHEIYNRPWGHYKTTFLNSHSQSKIITVNPGGELSLQEHKRREEHWVVVLGEGKVVLGESIMQVREGSYVFIPKGCKHRLVNTSDTELFMVAEVQLGDYFGEDDIIRYNDIYGRLKDNI